MRGFINKCICGGLLTFILFSSVWLSAQDFEERKDLFIASMLENGSPLVLQAYLGQPLDEAALNQTLYKITTSDVADFSITPIIRTLFLLEDTNYNRQILDTLSQVPFWLPDPDDLRSYASENHMIMWMSANWLLHESFGWEARPTLRQNLVHYLNLKNEFGFYEFISSVYGGLTITALLNLADFTQDEEIRTKAEAAVKKALNMMLMPVTEQGTHFAVAGRSVYDKYIGSGNFPGIIYLILGKGDVPAGSWLVGEAIATSNLDFTDVMDAYSEDLNVEFFNGHSFEVGRAYNDVLSREDRVIFQWSSGAYFMPQTAADYIWGNTFYDMWGGNQQIPFDLSWLPPSVGTVAAQIAGSISRSSYIGGINVAMFRNKNVALTSFENYWKGRLGWQQYPIMAAVGNNAVYTRSGDVFEGYRSNSNTTLPYIDQNENVALVMYRANWDLPIFGYDNFNVFLQWKPDRFDEVDEFDNWVVARKDDSYIAVRKHCADMINGFMACDDQDGQTWAFVVGNDVMHGNFGNFKDIIQAADYEERWYFKWQTFEWVYYGKINVDGKLIDYHWKGNVLSGPSNNGNRIENGRIVGMQEEAMNIKVYPNPASAQTTIDLRDLAAPARSISVMNMKGGMMFEKEIQSSSLYIEHDVSSFENGVYTILIEMEDGSKLIKRMLVQH